MCGVSGRVGGGVAVGGDGGMCVVSGGKVGSIISVCVVVLSDKMVAVDAAARQSVQDR